MKSTSLGRSWFAAVGLVTLLEVFFLYEGMQADLSGHDRIFGVFVGLAILCFAVLLYSVKAVFYDENREDGT